MRCLPIRSKSRLLCTPLYFLKDGYFLHQQSKDTMESTIALLMFLTGILVAADSNVGVTND